MRRLTVLHWAVAFTVALSFHAALAFNYEHADQTKIEKMAGAPIEVVGALSQFTHEKTLAAIEPTEVTEPVEAETAMPDVLEKIEPLTAQEVAAPLPTVKPDVVEAQKVEAVKKPVVEEKKPVKKKTKKAKKAKKAEKRKQRASTKTRARQKGGGAKGKQRRVAGRAVLSNYRGRVQSHLARYKRRPNSSGRGTVVVSFTIIRSGSARSIRLSRSSGNGAIDRAALSMVRNASPFPPIPAGGPSSMRFSVPVRYR